MDRALREVRRFMTNREGPGVVAVSGGADSVALLRALHATGRPLTVAHLNHQLRGAESDADAAFVQELAATLGVPCRVKVVDVAALAAGENLEATARRVRYEFFAEVAAETGAAWIATGHTADDQAETVLHRLVRGTGLHGLRGIAQVLANPDRQGGGGKGLNPTPPSLSGKGAGGLGSSEDPSPTPPPRGEGLNPTPPSLSGKGAGGLGCFLLRPLLTITRAEILQYLSALNQSFREDSSNADPRFTRNRIRHELLPLLKTFNPEVVSALAHLAEHANEAHEIISEKAAEVLTKAERPRAGNTVILDVAALGPSRAVTRAVLRLVWEREAWPVSEMGFDSWDRAVEVACRDGGACDFPGGVTMRRAGRVVQIGPRS